MVDSHGFGGKLAMVGMMVLQVVVAVIPGEVPGNRRGLRLRRLGGAFAVPDRRGDRFGNHFLLSLLGVKMVEAFYFPGKDQFSEIYQEQQAAEPADVYSVLHSRHPQRICSPISPNPHPL